jgi:hypothetical protein
MMNGISPSGGWELEDDPAGDDGGGGAAFEGPALEGVVVRFTGRLFGAEGPGGFRVDDGDVGIGSGREGAFVEPKDAGGGGGETGDEVGERESLGLDELHEGEGEFSFEAGDAEGCVIELDFLFVIAVGSVIAADDLEGAVGDAFKDGLAVGWGTEWGVHLEAGIVGGPSGEDGVGRGEALEGTAVAGPELLAAGEGCIGEGEVMGAGLAGDGNASLAGFAEQADAVGGGDVLAVDVGAGHFGEADVAGDDEVFAGGGPAAQAEHGAPVAFVHHAIGDDGIILAVVEHREVEHLCVFEGAAHELVVLDAMPVVRDGDDAGAFEGADGGEFLALEADADGPRDEDVDLGLALALFADQGDGARVIDGRGRIGHAEDGREAAAGGGGGAGGDGFLGGLAGFAEVDVEVDEAGGDDFAGGIEARAGGSGVGGGLGADASDLAFEDEQIGVGIEVVGRIDDPASGDEEVAHSGGGNI